MITLFHFLWRHKFILVLAAALGFGFYFLTSTIVNFNFNSKLNEFNSWASNLEQVDNSNTTLQAATVERVVDGDTIVVLLNGESKKVRLIGIDAAESVHPDTSKNAEEGKTASEHLKETLVAGTEVWLEKDTSDTDKYDRLLRYVWLTKPDTTISYTADYIKPKMLNAILVSDGYAKAKDFPPDTKYSKVFHSLENS